MVIFSLQFQSINFQNLPPPPQHKALKLKLEKETHQIQGVIELLVHFNHFPKNGTINITFNTPKLLPCDTGAPISSNSTDNITEIILSMVGYANRINIPLNVNPLMRVMILKILHNCT